MDHPKLQYLIDELCAAVEIYFTGRTGGQYHRTAFILCDDYAERTAKLFLLADNPSWSDTRSNGSFKNYHNIMTDVENAFRSSRLADVPTLTPIKTRMGDRRKRRNDFFHSTHLLDLSVIQRNVVEAFCDLFAFGELLFGADWQSYIESSRNLDTMRLLLLIEKEGYRDPPILQRAMEVIREQRRNKKAPPRAQKGYHVTEYPEDFHLRLSVLFGSNILRDKLKAILDSTPTSP